MVFRLREEGPVDSRPRLERAEGASARVRSLVNPGLVARAQPAPVNQRPAVLRWMRFGSPRHSLLKPACLLGLAYPRVTRRSRRSRMASRSAHSRR
jgi:hypothetical protein